MSNTTYPVKEVTVSQLQQENVAVLYLSLIHI